MKCVILFDQGFEVATGLYSMGLQTGFHILTLTRQVAFKCWTRRRVKEWVDALKETAATSGKFWSCLLRVGHELTLVKNRYLNVRGEQSDGNKTMNKTK